MEKEQTSCRTGRLGPLCGLIAENLTGVNRNMGSVQSNSATTRSIFFDWTSRQSYFSKLVEEM